MQEYSYSFNGNIDWLQFFFWLYRLNHYYNSKWGDKHRYICFFGLYWFNFYYYS